MYVCHQCHHHLRTCMYDSAPNRFSFFRKRPFINTLTHDFLVTLVTHDKKRPFNSGNAVTKSVTKASPCHQMQHHKEENTYQEGGTMDEGMRRTAEDGAELLDFRKVTQERNFIDTMFDVERAEIRSWLDEDAMERIRGFAAYMESHGHDPERLTEVIEKMEHNPLLLTIYDLMNAGTVLHMVPCVTFHDEVPFVEAINEHKARG